MGIWGHESDLERPNLRGLLENAMRCADPGIGASENDNVLHGLKCKTWVFDSSKVVYSEEVKEDVDCLLKDAYGTTKDISHRKCKYGVLEPNKYICDTFEYYQFTEILRN